MLHECVLSNKCKVRASPLCKQCHGATEVSRGQGDGCQGLQQQALYCFSLESACQATDSPTVSVPSAKFKIWYISQTLISTFICNHRHDTPDLFPALHNPSIVAGAHCRRRGEGCPFHQPALLLHAHARTAAFLAALVENSEPSSLHCWHTSRPRG